MPKDSPTLGGSKHPTGCFFEFEESDGGRELVITLQKHTPGFYSWTKLLESDDQGADTTVTHRTWFDIEAGV